MIYNILVIQIPIISTKFQQLFAYLRNIYLIPNILLNILKVLITIRNITIICRIIYTIFKNGAQRQVEH